MANKSLVKLKTSESKLSKISERTEVSCRITSNRDGQTKI